MLNWVKKGEFIVKADKLEFDWKKSDHYLQATLKNEGKYDVDDDGVLVEKGTRKPAKYYYGFPFPKIDPGDPFAAEKIMQNNVASTRSQGSTRHNKGRNTLIGENGPHKQTVSGAYTLYYVNRLRGPMPNPNNFLMQCIYEMTEPYDMRGIINMSWRYNDMREDTCMTYLPMLKGVRRMSAASRSDPSGGSDICYDDAYGFDGKVASMTWEYIGEKTLLAPIVSSVRGVAKDNPDGSIYIQNFPTRRGYEDDHIQVAPWCPLDWTWTPRPSWIVEANPKDPYYNYGRQLLYVDKDTYLCYLKEVYDRSGEYWKTIMVAWASYASPKGKETFNSDIYLVIDDKMYHSTFVDLELPAPYFYYIDRPLTEDLFTAANMIQLSK